MASAKVSALVVVVCLSLAGNARAADDSYLEQGIQLYNQKNYKAAIQSLELASRVDSNNPSVWYYLGNVAYAAGDRPAAIKFYWYVARQFSTAKEAYYSRNVLRNIDSDYSKNAAYSVASVTPTRASRTVSSADRSIAEGSKQQLVENLLQVLRSQGNRPNVSERLIANTKAVLYSYPTGLLSLLSQKGIKVCLTPTTIDQDPRWQNTKPNGYEEGYTYKNCPGFFNGQCVVVCEYALSGSDDSSLVHADDPIGTLRHEMGHAFDRCLGYASTSDEFKHAYYLDVGRIEEEVKPRLAYYLQTARSGPSETFAELACYDFGGYPTARRQSTCQLVYSSFKQTAEVVKQKLEQACQR